MSLSLMFFKGWFVIQSVTPSAAGIEYLLLEPRRNVYVTVSLPGDRALGLVSTGEIYGENQQVKIQVWARCDQNQTETRVFICDAEPDKLRELPCRPNEGIWINGVQYC
jgi:hypothetical protein